MMFNSGGTTPNNTSLFGQSTPVNQNRTPGSFLFGNTTTTQPTALTSTPFSSSTLFGNSKISIIQSSSISFLISAGTTPSNTTLQVPSAGTGTIHKFDALLGADKINKNGIQTQIRTKIYNLCAMPVYEKKSTEVN
jgi:hypothetical protein